MAREKRSVARAAAVLARVKKEYRRDVYGERVEAFFCPARKGRNYSPGPCSRQCPYPARQHTRGALAAVIRQYATMLRYEFTRAAVLSLNGYRVYDNGPAVGPRRQSST